MKKTLTVNLGGIVFNIDEDAYQLLDNYLSNLRVHFSQEEGTDEIMDDFEARISELLNDRIRKGFQVITITHVEEVIGRMGKPEDIFAEEDHESDAENHRGSTINEEKTKKRLMRNPDDRILGGVASGLAVYWGVDATVIRLILLVLLFLPVPIPFSLIIVIYLILWLVVPPAKTAADKLVMRGENVNLENIGKTVTDSFEKVSNNVNEYLHSEKPRTALQKTGDFIVSFFGVLLKICAVLLGIVLIPALLVVISVLLVLIIAIIVGGIGNAFTIPFINEEMMLISEMPNSIALIGTIGSFLFFSIPVVGLIYTFCGRLLKLSPIPTGAKWMMIILWFVSLILCAITVYYAIKTGTPFQFTF